MSFFYPCELPNAFSSFIIQIGKVSEKNTETHSWLSLTDRLRDRWGAKDFFEGVE